MLGIPRGSCAMKMNWAGLHHTSSGLCGSMPLQVCWELLPLQCATAFYHHLVNAEHIHDKKQNAKVTTTHGQHAWKAPSRLTEKSPPRKGIRRTQHARLQGRTHVPPWGRAPLVLDVPGKGSGSLTARGPHMPQKHCWCHKADTCMALGLLIGSYIFVSQNFTIMHIMLPHRPCCRSRYITGRKGWRAGPP